MVRPPLGELFSVRMTIMGGTGSAGQTGASGQAGQAGGGDCFRLKNQSNIYNDVLYSETPPGVGTDLKIDSNPNSCANVATPMYGRNCSMAYTRSLCDLTTICTQLGVELRNFFLANESDHPLCRALPGFRKR